MKWLALSVLMLVFCGCEVRVEDKDPDIKVVKPPDVEVTTPKVDVEVNRDQ